MRYLKVGLTIMLVAASSLSFAGDGNTTFQSFSKSKSTLLKKVYSDYNKTLYCENTFNQKKAITHSKGYESKKYVKRSFKLEWEHVVPAENFGRNFAEWRDGDKECVTKKGKGFKGRRCAEKTNTEFRFMAADLYNLYPATGSNNALRSNHNFMLLPNEKSDFGACAMKVEKGKVEPPAASRGRIARTYLYMEHAYSKYKMSSAQKKLMIAWDKMYPVTQWECVRAQRIKKLQGNTNPFVQRQCR